MKTNTLALALGLILASSLLPVAAAPTGTGTTASTTSTGLDFDGIVAPSVSLRQAVMVHDVYVRLGDLFDGAGQYANRTVLQAPEPGKRLIVDAISLYRVAHAYGLAWRPFGKNDRAIIERASQLLDRSRVEPEIRSALLAVANGIADDDEIALTDRRLEIYIPAEAEASITVENINYDARTRRFTCVVVAPAGAPDAKRIMVGGRIHATVEVPVLKSQKRKGEVITAADVLWSRVHSDDVRQGTVNDLDQIVGMTPTRVVKAMAPVRSDDIQQPMLVTKGAIVTMIVKTPTMTLTAQGKAQDDGPRNATIHVQNTLSNRTLIATVINANTVMVQTGSLAAAY